jgi:hypothetical protein
MRIALLATLAALLVAPAAAAHGGSSGETGYVTRLDRITNANGIDVSASSDGHFTLTAPRGETVVVRGYSNEPYLLFSSNRIFENERSPTTYLSKDKTPPADLNADAPPKWNEVATGRTYTWHDHRIHWMGTDDPEVVRRDRDHRHHISNWTVGGTVGGKPFEVHGSLDWVPQKDNGLGWKWLLTPIVGGAFLYALFLTFAGRRGQRPAQARPSD